MNIIDIPDIQNLIKSYITDNPLSPDIIKQYLISKKYKELVFPSVIEDIIFSYNPITFFDLFIKNKIPTQDLDYDNFNYLELSKNPKTYPFIKYLLRELNPSVDVDSKLITELKNNPPLMDGVSVFYSHEYRLCKSLIKNYKKNAGKKYHEFWININKYDSKFIILDDKKNRKHISFNIKNPYVNENFVKIIKNKFFGNIENIDLESINIFLKLYDIYIRRTDNIMFILCRCNNNKIHKYIKHIINKKKIKITDRLIENLCYSKNKLAHSTIHNFLEEKSILGENFSEYYIKPFVNILLMNDSIPEEIYDIIGIKNMNIDLLYTIKNNNIKKFIIQAFTKNSDYGIPLLCNNPNTVDIIYQYIEKDKKKLDNIPIGYLLINETNNEKYQEYIFNIFLKKYEYEKKRKNVNYIYNQISLNLTKIFNPKVLSYILDNNFLFIDTKVVLLYIQKEYDKENLELKKIAKDLITNFKYNPDGLKYIKKYNLWNIIDIDFISTNPVCIEMLCSNLYTQYFNIEIDLIKCMNLFIKFLDRVQNDEKKIQKYKKNIEKIYRNIEGYTNDFNNEEKKLFNIIKLNSIIDFKL